MKILAVSDHRLPEMEHPDQLRHNFGEAKLLISCGDLNASYLEYLSGALNLPLFFVRGNHDEAYDDGFPGGDNLHGCFRRYLGITMAGLEGSIYYNGRNVQHTESRMATFALQLLPRLVIRRFRHGYGADYLVTHSSPRNIHDADDRAHHGFRSFLWLMRLGQPRYLIHGHVDVWDRRKPTETLYYKTKVININPKRLLSPFED